MEYVGIVEGIFESRPNRFIAHVKVNGETVVSHVKNTGRCRELLLPGARVFLEYHPEAAEGKRKTAYDLIGVYKGDILINMDSQAPNRVAFEWVQSEQGPHFCCRKDEGASGICGGRWCTGIPGSTWPLSWNQGIGL